MRNKVLQSSLPKTNAFASETKVVRCVRDLINASRTSTEVPSAEPLIDAALQLINLETYMPLLLRQIYPHGSTPARKNKW